MTTAELERGPLADMRAAHPEAEVQTDKAMAKVVPCVGCAKDLLVNVFYAASIAKCRECKGETAGATTGSATIVQAGRTDPALAKDLGACLINRHEFEVMVCPFGHGDMELKSVSHNDQYGPHVLAGYSGGKPIYKKVADGETVLHQCNECLCTVTMSTTATHAFKRQNEPKAQLGQGANAWKDINGVRD